MTNPFTEELIESGQDWLIRWRVIVDHAMIEFEIMDGNGKAEVIMRGTIRFDGCMNLEMPSGYHSCAKSQATSIGVVLGRVYDIAAENLKYNCI